MNYKWNYATPADSADIMELNLLAQFEVDKIFNFTPNVWAHNIVTALVDQFYNARSNLLMLARDTDNKLLAYTWVKTVDGNMWSTEAVATVVMAHVDPDLSVRQRILLLKDMLKLWEQFALQYNIPVICSNTIRSEQAAFLKLHKQNGYDVRGSIAYKRIDPTQATPAD
mgnify:CR=1 FL=1|jgi:hypothetical protein